MNKQVHNISTPTGTSPELVLLTKDEEVAFKEAINIERQRLQADYDSQEYARNRKQEYDKLNQWEMQFDDQRDGTSTWVDSINEIKERFPK